MIGGSNIPTEIIDLIMGELYFASKLNDEKNDEWWKGLCSSLLVCKSLYYSARKQAFANITVAFNIYKKNPATKSLCKILEANQSLLMEVESFRVYLWFGDNLEERSEPWAPEIPSVRSRSLVRILTMFSNANLRAFEFLSPAQQYEMGCFGSKLVEALTRIRCAPSLRHLSFDFLACPPPALLVPYKGEDNLETLELFRLDFDDSIVEKMEDLKISWENHPSTSPSPFLHLQVLTLVESWGFMEFLSFMALPPGVQLPNLLKLSIEEPEPPDTGFQELIKACPSLTFLSLKCNFVLEHPIAKLAVVPSLRELILSRDGTYISGERSPKYQAGLAKFVDILENFKPESRLETLTLELGGLYQSDEDKLRANPPRVWGALDRTLTSSRFPSLRRLNIRAEVGYERRNPPDPNQLVGKKEFIEQRITSLLPYTKSCDQIQLSLDVSIRLLGRSNTT